MTSENLVILFVVIAVAITMLFGLVVASMNTSNCSSQEIENAYVSGADKLYEQLVQAGRIKE